MEADWLLASIDVTTACVLTALLYAHHVLARPGHCQSQLWQGLGLSSSVTDCIATTTQADHQFKLILWPDLMWTSVCI